MNSPVADAGPLRVAVIGAGVSGLAAAMRLVTGASTRSLPLEVVVLEAAPRPGGVTETTIADGFVMEHGPDSMISTKASGPALAENVGLKDELVGTNPEHRRSYVVKQGELHPVPEGFYLLAPTAVGPFLKTPLFSWPGKLRMALDLVLPRRDSPGDESLGSFVRRRLGVEALERMAQPLVGGIYSADPDVLSLQATMPQFLELERKYRSVIVGLVRSGKLLARSRGDASRASGARYGLFLSLSRGLGSLVAALVARLGPGAIRTSTRVRSLVKRPAGGYSLAIDTAGELSEIPADGVVVALPAPAAARVLEPLDRDLAARMAEIRYASVGTVNLVYRQRAPSIPPGAGLVVPAREPSTMMALTFSSQKYPGRAPAGGVLLRAFFGGAMHPAAFTMDEKDLLAGIRDDVRRLLGVDAVPAEMVVNRYADSMAQYRVGHLEHVAGIEELVAHHPALALAGNAFRGVGVPDCILSGETAADRVLEALAGASSREP